MGQPEWTILWGQCPEEDPCVMPNGEFVLALEFTKVFKVKTTAVDGSSES